ncbi:MAG: hypothetical protein H7A09_10755 [Oceanospirillaceae bacterium]|nr:hypothetical protein [Oceanospirillaceae bacterium]
MMLLRSLELDKVITSVATGELDVQVAKRKATSILYGIVDVCDDDVDVIVADVFDKVCNACGFKPIEVEIGPGTRALTDVRRIFALVMKYMLPEIGPTPIAKKLRRERTATYSLWESGCNLLQHDQDFRQKYDCILDLITNGAHD